MLTHHTVPHRFSSPAEWSHSPLPAQQPVTPAPSPSSRMDTADGGSERNKVLFYYLSGDSNTMLLQIVLPGRLTLFPALFIRQLFIGRLNEEVDRSAGML